MLETFRRLILGLALIAGAAVVLLLSDTGSRTKPSTGDGGASTQTAKSIAFLQHASQSALDQGRDGVFAALAEKGWIEGKNLQVRRFNAEGDIAVSQAIAREMVNGDSDLLVTVSTGSLQSVANANRAGKKKHVFGLVTDPTAAGVGFSRGNPLDHPAWMAGFGSMQPVEKAFKLALRMDPKLKVVGVVWNPAEANSEAQVKLAREACASLGLTLMETGVENSAQVGEAAAALVARGPDALWIPGDVTILNAVDTIITAANKGDIPVFTVVPPYAKHGAIFDLGADYFEIGRLVGLLTADVLNGRDPASVPMENVMPEMLSVNLQTAAKFKDKWTVPSDILPDARLIIDEQGNEESKASRPNPNPSGKKWRIGMVLYTESLPAEETLEGIKAGFAKSRLVAGKDYELKMRSAQGDMAALPGIYDAALMEADLIVPLSTPSLQTAVRKVTDRPVVFSLVANPVAAGAGKSYTDHAPNITGVAVLGPAADMLDLLQKYFPQYKRLGTLFCPSETNSVDLKESFEKLCKQRGYTLEAVAANSAGELPDAAMALMSRPIDAVVQISDNLSSAGFTAITKAARQAQKPLISLNSTTVPLGSAIAMGRDYHHAGEVTVEMIERVISGEDPGKMPFVLPPKVLKTASLPNAAAVGMKLPPELLKECDKVIE